MSSIGPLITKILENFQEAINIAVQYNILPSRHAILKCPKCNDRLTYYFSNNVWRCHNRNCGCTRSICYPIEMPKNCFQNFLGSLFLFAADIPIYQAIKLFNIDSQILKRNYASFRKKIYNEYIKIMQTHYLSFHIQIDESAFGKRGVVWIFGACDSQKGGSVYMVPVEHRDEATLVPIIQSWAQNGTIINSDGWASYNNLENYGFPHYVVNHSENFVNPVTKEHTQRIESLWKSAKDFLRIHHYNCHLYLNWYIAEWCFRYNNNNDLYKIIQAIMKN